MLHLIPTTSFGPRGWTRAALIVGTGAMVTAWLGIWAGLLGAAAGTATALPWPAEEAIVLIAAPIARWLLLGPLGERWLRVVFTLAAAPTVFLVMWARYYIRWAPLDPRWLLHAVETTRAGHGADLVVCSVMVLVLWVAGGRIGAGVLDDYEVFRSFGFGLAGLFAGLVLGAMASAQGAAVGAVGPNIVLFFGAAFLTMPLAQFTSAQMRGRALGTAPAALDHRWILTAAGAALAILSLALLLSGTISLALIDGVTAGFGRLPDLLLWVLYPFILIAAYVVQELILFVRGLAGPPHGGTTGQPPIHPPPRPLTTHGTHTAAHPPPLFHLALEWVALILIAAIIVIVVSRAIGRLGGLRREQSFEEERDSVWSWREARVDWRGLFSWRGALHHKRGMVHDDTGPPRTVREAYRRLLRFGAGLGVPRAAPETPLEYLGRWHGAPLPDERDAAILTAAYARARYGEDAEGAEEIEHAVGAWARLDGAVRQAREDRGSKAV